MDLTSVFTQVLQMSLTGCIVTFIVYLARLLLKRAPKIYSYALWSLVLFRLLCPFSFTSDFSILPDEITSGAVVSEWSDDYVGDSEVYFDNRPEYDAAIEAGRDPIDAGEGGQYVVTAPDGISEPNTVENTWFPKLAVIWLVGIGAMLLYSGISYSKIRRQVQIAVPFKKNVYLADDVESPFVMGFLRPKIYLPGTLTPHERRYIIQHERHHIRRGDHIFKALGFLALIIHWFNPLVWLAFILASRDMEMSCDEAVIRKLGEDVRAEYSATLLNLATGHRIIAGIPLAFGEGDPKGRIRNLAKWQKPALWVIGTSLLLSLILAVCVLTNPPAKNTRLMGAEYIIQEVQYAVTVGEEESTEPPLMYCVTADYHLYDKKEEEEGWNYIGKLEPYALTNGELNRYMPVVEMRNQTSVKEVSDAYILRVENDNFYLAFQTESGDTFLAYGWEDKGERGDSASDDTRLRRLYKLENRFTEKNAYDTSFMERSLVNTVGMKVDSFEYFTNQDFPGYALLGFMADGDFQSNMTDMGFAVFEISEDHGYRLLDWHVYDNAALIANGIFHCPDPAVFGTKGTNKNTFDVILSCTENLARIERLYYKDDVLQTVDSQVVYTEYAMSLFSWESEEGGNRVEQHYYDHDGNPIEDDGLKILSLNDVILLSQKGNDLSWADFEPYAYVEVGFGFYIRNYPINDQYALLIGSSGPEEHPMYFSLKNRLNDNSIDIREESVTKFLEENQEITAETTILPEYQNWAVSTQTHDVTPEHLVLTYHNELDDPIWRLPGYTIQRWQDGQWINLNVGKTWHETTEQVDFDHLSNPQNGMFIQWDGIGTLPEGNYLIGQEFCTEADLTKGQRFTVYASFEITEESGGIKPLEDLPELYSAEQAMIDGCLVNQDSEVLSDTLPQLQAFMEAANRGETAFLRIVNWYYGDNSFYTTQDLTFDGNQYILEWIEDGQRQSRTYRYLKHFTGEKERENMAYDAYEHYVLVNDNTVTWQQIYDGLVSSQLGANIDHWTISSDYIYYTKHPDLPDKPNYAILEFMDEGLITILDGERLDKLTKLFENGEYLGYEPKTHSIDGKLKLIFNTNEVDFGANGGDFVIELDPDSDICRINGEYVFYGAADEPDYIQKLWEYLGITQWPDIVYMVCENALRP